MNLNKYLQGKGLDVSRNFSGIKNAKHFFVEPDNFYTLKKFVDYESRDFIYSKNLINDTKFFRILLKEWLNFCKVRGKIIIEMKSNKILNFDKLIDESKLLLGEKTKIIEKIKTSEGGIIVLEKIKNVLEKNDSIDKWTFGIITNGSKEDVLENQIDSILALNVPNFEIIICGPYNPKTKYKKFVKTIPFKPKIAWITLKKNLICKKAKYENLVITHNRFNFDKNWHEGMKKYGNFFEVIVCKILSPSGKRAGDWITHGTDIRNQWVNQMGLLQYKDWDENLVINGSFHILKKAVWKKCPWDDSLIYGQSEDDKLSLDFHRKGIVPRFNLYSTMHTFPERYGNWHWIYTFNNKRLGKIPFEFSTKYLQRKIDRFIRKYFNIGFIRKQDYETYGWS